VYERGSKYDFKDLQFPTEEQLRHEEVKIRKQGDDREDCNKNVFLSGQ
jgi:hypothetical protein